MVRVSVWSDCRSWVDIVGLTGKLFIAKVRQISESSTEGRGGKELGLVAVRSAWGILESLSMVNEALAGLS